MNKALVSVGQRPIISHHLQALRERGTRDVIVVVGPDSEEQVLDVINRSHAGLNMNVVTVTQESPLGPGHALYRGAGMLPYDYEGSVIVLMADSYIEPSELYGNGDWVGVSPAPSSRHWCYWDLDPARWYEGFIEEGSTPVAVGVYRFSSAKRLFDATMRALNRASSAELLMAPVLNAYGKLDLKPMPTWQDIGDVRALNRVRGAKFISRSFNHLSLNEYGALVKVGSGVDFVAELEVLRSRPGHPAIWPELYSTQAIADGGLEAEMEYIDLPTLAELYLFWPGRPDMWAAIIEHLLDRLQETLWRVPPMMLAQVGDSGISHRCRAMYLHKPRDRFKAWEHPIKKHDVIRYNGFTYDAGPVLIARLGAYIEKNVFHGSRFGTLHGDLNMANVLYSLGTGTFKLVDPRGNWGGVGPAGDLRYELAKLRYCYADHFTSITHGLFDATVVEEEVFLRFGPERSTETEAIDEVFKRLVPLDVIKAIEASIFLSAMPLHAEDEAIALYAQGVKLANEVLT